MSTQNFKKNFSLCQNPASTTTMAAIGILALLLLLGTTGCTEKTPSGEEISSEAVIERIKPIGKVNVVSTAQEATEPEEASSAPATQAQEEPPGEAQKTDRDSETSPSGDHQETQLTRGKAIVENNCAPCHSGNLPGAPMLGNPADWTDRLSQNKETLIEHVINGYNAMPPRGGNPNLSDEDIAAAVTYIISQAKQ